MIHATYKEDSPAGMKSVEGKRYGSDNSPTRGKKIGSSVTGKAFSEVKGSYKEDAPTGWKDAEGKRYGSGNFPTQGGKVGSSITGNGVKGTERKY